MLSSMNKGLIGCLGIGGIILFIVLIGGCAVAGSYNRLVGLQQNLPHPKFAE